MRENNYAIGKNAWEKEKKLSSINNHKKISKKLPVGRTDRRLGQKSHGGGGRGALRWFAFQGQWRSSLKIGGKQRKGKRLRLSRGKGGKFASHYVV